MNTNFILRMWLSGNPGSAFTIVKMADTFWKGRATARALEQFLKDYEPALNAMQRTLGYRPTVRVAEITCTATGKVVADWDCR